MKVHLGLIITAFCSFLVSSELSHNEFPNEVTPLLPQDLLGIFGKSDVTRLSRVRKIGIQGRENELKVVLVGKMAKAKEIVAGFLDLDSSTNQVRAVFLVKDGQAKELIETLIDQDGYLRRMMAVLVIKDSNASEFFRKLVGEKAPEEDIKGVLIVKDASSKSVVDHLLNSNNQKQEIETLLLGKNDHAKELIHQFLHQYDKAHEMKMALFAKDDDTKPMVNKLLEKTDSENDVKIVLIGRETTAKKVLGTMLDDQEKIEGIKMSVVSGGDKAKALLEEVIRKANSDGDTRVVLFNEEGQEQVLSQGFLTKNVVNPNTINEELFSQTEKGKYINEGLVGNPADLDNCDIEEIKNKTVHARAQLEVFFRSLKFFMLERNFDFNAFESQGSQLYQKLGSISSFIRKMSPCNKPVLDELAYIRRTFDAMVEAIEVLKYYETSTAPGHRLLFSLVDLNVRLYGLRNFRGEPDVLGEGYSRKVTTYAQFVSFWGSQFKKYAYVPFGEEMSFKKYHNRAEASLITLARHALKPFQEVPP